MCWRLLDAQHWADPRLARRQRVFVVADFGGRRAGAVLFKPRRLFPLPAPCGDFGLPPAGGNRISAFETGGPLPVVHPFQGYRMRGAAKAGDVGNFLGSFGKPTDPFPTLMAGGLTVFALWREGREAEGVITWLTPTEGERAMGLPDGWTAYGHDGRPVSARARQKALGNSIALPCAEYIMAGVKEELKGGKPYRSEFHSTFPGVHGAGTQREARAYALASLALIRETLGTGQWCSPPGRSPSAGRRPRRSPWQYTSHPPGQRPAPTCRQGL